MVVEESISQRDKGRIEKKICFQIEESHRHPHSPVNK